MPRLVTKLSAHDSELELLTRQAHNILPIPNIETIIANMILYHHGHTTAQIDLTAVNPTHYYLIEHKTYPLGTKKAEKQLIAARKLIEQHQLFTRPFGAGYFSHYDGFQWQIKQLL